MTYSPAKRIAVPSALKGLTSGFGMGPGGPPSQLSPVSLSLSKSAVPFPGFPLRLRAGHPHDVSNSTKLKQVKASED